MGEDREAGQDAALEAELAEWLARALRAERRLAAAMARIAQLEAALTASEEALATHRDFWRKARTDADQACNRAKRLQRKVERLQALLKPQ